jgi:uncharacterized protein (TIGR03435 family)
MTALVNHLWQSTIFLLGVWLLTFALRRNQARTRYCLWMLASAKFLVPFSVLIAAGELLHPTSYAGKIQPAFSSIMGEFAQPLSMSAVPAQTASAVIHSVAKVAGAPAIASAHWNVLPVILIAFWLSGAIFLLARWSWRWRQLRAAVRDASPVALGLACVLPVLSTDILNLEPGIFGILRPVLLLPKNIQERLTESQLDAVIAHEMCHVRRRDNLTAALHMVSETIFWFYPAVWWIRRGLLEERERACDEAVLESRREALTYAEGILNVCKLYVEAPMSCVAGVTGSDLKKRIMRIMAKQAARKLDLGRKVLLSLVAVLAVAVPVTVGLMHATQMQAQTAPAKTGIEDTWQGTLHLPGGRDLRIVAKVTNEAAGLKVVTYSVDQGGAVLPANSASFDHGTFKFSIQAINASYEGKMSADSKSIAGTLTQGAPIPLLFERVTPATEWAIPEPPPKIPAMAADADPSFEVATIKPSKPDQPGKLLTVRGAKFSTINTTVVDLLDFAYGIQTKQIVNAPPWFASDKFDIDAQPNIPGTPSDRQLKSMIQKLLADRLQLKFHRENRELSAYVLTVGKGGPKLTKSDGDPNGLPGLFFRQLGELNVMNATMGDFTGLMQSAVLDRPVVDQTGLQGRWNFLLKWTPDESQFSGMGVKVPPPTDAPDAPPPLFTAIQEQIGLKLESGKAPVPVLVLDHVEKPSEN